LEVVVGVVGMEMQMEEMEVVEGVLVGEEEKQVVLVFQVRVLQEVIQ